MALMLDSEFGRGEYRVQNFAMSARGAQKNGRQPYWKGEKYPAAMESSPDVAILMIGTNDNQEWWDPEAFERDYLELASRIKNLTSKPDLFIMTSPPMSTTYHNKTMLP